MKESTRPSAWASAGALKELAMGFVFLLLGVLLGAAAITTGMALLASREPRWSGAAFVIAGVGFFVLPVAAGAIAVIPACVALFRGEKLAWWALLAAVISFCWGFYWLGIILGAQ